MTTFLLRIEQVATGRVWWEVREGEDDCEALIESVLSNHPTNDVLLGYTELIDDGPTWIAGAHLHTLEEASVRLAQANVALASAIEGLQARDRRIAMLEDENTSLKRRL